MKIPKITISLREFRRINAYRKMINASDPKDLIIIDDKGYPVEHDPKALGEWNLSGLSTWDYFCIFLGQESGKNPRTIRVTKKKAAGKESL